MQMMGLEMPAFDAIFFHSMQFYIYVNQISRIKILKFRIDFVDF